MKFKKKQKLIFAGRPGFTLVEIIMVVSIISIIMVSLAGIFSSSIRGYRAAKATQRDLEDTQFIMNQMVKILRTSSVAESDAKSITVFDYSQQKCFKYAFSNETIEFGKTEVPLAPSEGENPSGPRKEFDNDRAGWCNDNPPEELTSMAAFYVKEGNFLVVPSINGELGKVTVSMELCQDLNCSEDRTRIQSSVSLRDYYKAGI